MLATELALCVQRARARMQQQKRKSNPSKKKWKALAKEMERLERLTLDLEAKLMWVSDEGFRARAKVKRYREAGSMLEARRLTVANMAMYDTALQFLEQMEKSSNPNRDAQAFKQAWITRDFEADACEAVGRDWLCGGGSSSSDDDDDEASDY